MLKFDLKLGSKLGFSPLISISYYGKIGRKIQSQIRENLGEISLLILILD